MVSSGRLACLLSSVGFSMSKALCYCNELLSEDY